MAKLYLRPIGGLGARLIPLLQGLSAVRESSHELVVCWPLSSRRGGGRSGAHREQSFELPLTDLYDFDPKRLFYQFFADSVSGRPLDSRIATKIKIKS